MIQPVTRAEYLRLDVPGFWTTIPDAYGFRYTHQRRFDFGIELDKARVYGIQVWGILYLRDPSIIDTLVDLAIHNNYGGVVNLRCYYERQGVAMRKTFQEVLFGAAPTVKLGPRGARFGTPIEPVEHGQNRYYECTFILTMPPAGKIANYITTEVVT
jgi:hypothetical protein